MAARIPVSDLCNYNTVLDQVEIGSPVYLTVKGRGRYTTWDIVEDEECEKTKAMLRLMCELDEGRRSGEEEGYIPSDDVRACFTTRNGYSNQDFMNSEHYDRIESTPRIDQAIFEAEELRLGEEAIDAEAAFGRLDKKYYGQIESEKK